MLVPDPQAALATLLLTSAVAIGCAAPPRLAADLVVTRAAIWTGNPAQPSAEAVAVIGDRIVDVGSADAIATWTAASTTVIDAGGRRVVPGFNDAQVSFIDGGTELDHVDLRDADSAAEFARRINERAKAKPGEWILGGRWDERQWQPASLPTRASIDEITNSSPVFVTRYDGRMALANAAALGRAGITERTPDPPEGALVRDANGFPTGLLQGTAMDLVARAIPAMTADQRIRAAKRAIELAESLGVTSVQDAGATAEDIAAYSELAARGELTVRVYAIAPEGGWYDQAKLGVRRAFGSPWLRIGAIRARFDGVDAGDLQTRLMAADHAGLQLSVSAAGDVPSLRMFDRLDAIVRANGGRDRRFRIDAAHPLPEARDRLVSLNAIALIQADAADRSLFDADVRVALGSRWPASGLNPMRAVQAAQAKQITAAQALAAYTSGSAFAEFQEAEKGTIARGKLADMVVLSDDILGRSATPIQAVRPVTTIVGGKIVHQRRP